MMELWVKLLVVYVYMYTLEHNKEKVLLFGGNSGCNQQQTRQCCFYSTRTPYIIWEELIS